MRNKTLVITLIVLAPAWAQAQDAANRIAGDVMSSPKTPLLSIDALCAQLTPDEVTAIVGKKFVRVPKRDALLQGCTYGDSTEKGELPIRYFRLENAKVSDSGFRRFVEVEAKGRVLERDGVLVAQYPRNRLGSIWFKDRKGHALVLNVNSGIKEDKAVALAKASVD